MAQERCEERQPHAMPVHNGAPTPSSDPAAAEHDPRRSPRQTCPFYKRTGTCAFGNSCRFQHPPHERPNLHFNSAGLPLRNGEPVCEFFAKHACCGFGIVCKYHHPESVLAAAAAAAASSPMPLAPQGLRIPMAPTMAARPPPYAAYMQLQPPSPYPAAAFLSAPPSPASPFAVASSMMVSPTYTTAMLAPSAYEPVQYGSWPWYTPPWLMPRATSQDSIQLQQQQQQQHIWSPPSPAPEQSSMGRSASGPVLSRCSPSHRMPHGSATRGKGRRRSNQSTPSQTPSPSQGAGRPDAAVVSTSQGALTGPGSVLNNLLPARPPTVPPTDGYASGLPVFGSPAVTAASSDYCASATGPSSLSEPEDPAPDVLAIPAVGFIPAAAAAHGNPSPREWVVGQAAMAATEDAFSALAVSEA